MISKYLEIIDKNKDLQIKTLQDLVSIKSVVSNPVSTRDGEVYPFGKGVQDAFVYTLKKAEEFGFETKNVDNYGGHIDFGSGSETVGILAHLDVVPEGSDWSFEPYGGAIAGDYIYGRGTTDDKGPLISVLFAMKALKEAGYEPSRKVRLILGLDEETGWKGMEYYFQREKKPDFGFTPDGDFPAINGEMGIVSFDIAKKFSKSQTDGLALSKLSGGDAVNMVPEKARAVVKAKDTSAYDRIRSLAEAYRSESGNRINIKGVGKSLEIVAVGKSAHGSTPEAGINAISVLMEFMGRLNFANDDVNVFVDFYNKYIGFDCNGVKAGIGLSDEASGKLTLNVGVIEYKKEAVTLKINVRYPVTCNVDQVYDGIMNLINQYDMGLIKGLHREPIYMEPESPMIKTLVDCYAGNTGDSESKPLVIGGGTYARATENVVGFGALFPGDEDRMHQKDERLSIDRFMLTTRIYADAVYRLTQPDFAIDEDKRL